MIIRTRALFLMGLIVAVSCSDSGNPLTPDGGEPPTPASLVALDCTVSVTGGGMQCALPQPGTGAASGSGELIVGGQNVYVSLAASNFSTPADTIQFDVTVQNLIPQALGTTDGVSAHPDGVRVFFYDGPVSNNPSAAASVANPDGSAFFTSASQPYFQWNEMLAPNQTSAPRTWKIQYTPGSTSVSFRVYVWAQVQYENGWVDVTPPADTLEQGGTTTLSATARDRIGRTGTVSQTFTWSRGGDGVTTVDASTGEVTALAASGVDTIYVTNGTQTGRAIIIVENAPAFQQDTIAAVSNLTVGRPAPRLASRISDTESNADVVPGTYTSVAGGTARVYADGSYDYLSPAGFSGADSFEFDISDGVHTIKGSVIVNVAAGNYWYVQAGGTGDGRDRFPLGSIAVAQDSAAVGDSIFVLAAGATALEGAVVLEDAQALIGQGIPASITRPLNDTTITVLAAGDAPGLSRTDAGPAVTLGAGNTVRGLGITAAGGAGITGNAFGTLTTSHLGVSATGPALHLTTGTLAAEFDVLSSTNSASQGLFLSGVDGSLTVTGGAISGATGTAIEIVGGDATITYPGNVTQGNSVPLLSVSGNHTGTLTFAGTVSATAGTGLQFDDADGGYDFTGTTTLNGGDAGVDIGNGSEGTFAFGTGITITSPTGTAFAVNGSSPVVTYSGDVTQANNALLVDVSEQPGGSITFQTGTLSASSGTGIQLSNADGSVSFNGTTTLNGGDAGVDVLADANGTFAFTSGASITNGTGHGLEVFESAPTLTFAGSISTSAARPVVVDGASPCGSITLTGAISATGEGILVQDCSAGTVSFNGTSKTLNTGANQAVTLTNNAGATIGFGGGGLAITTTGVTGFGASGGGTVTVTGANNTVSTGTGTGLALNGVGTGVSGVTFRSVSTGAAANGIALDNLTGVGVTVTGDGSTGGSGGSITGTTGHGVSLTNLGALTTGVGLNFMNVSTGAGGNASIFGSTFGTLTFSGTSLSATGGPALNLATGAVSGTFSSLSSSSSASTGVSLTGVTGTLNVSAGTITGGTAGTAFSVSGGSVGGTIASAISQGNPAQAALAVAGGHTTGTLTFTGSVSASNGTGLHFDNADGTYAFGGTVTLNGGDAGIDVTNGSSGTFTFPATASITSPSTGNLVSILNSAPTFTYPGAFTKANNNVTGILLQSNTGGTINFNGSGVTKSISSGTAAAVSLVNNTGATVNFSGGSLAITSGTGAGFNATGGGTLQVTGASNSINSVGGTALNVNGVTIGAGGLTFVRIDASNGANGIVLNNTGNTNGLQVTGTGTAGTGGTIQNMTTRGASFTSARNINLSWMNFTNTPTADGGAGGVCDATVNTGCNAAIKLDAVTTVNLDRLSISGGVEQGITGTNVTGLSLTNSTIQNTGDAVSEHGIYINDLRGTTAAGTANLISNNTITNAGSHNIFINTQTATNVFPGSPDRLVIQNNSITNPGSAGQSDGITVTARGTANFQTVVQANTFTSTRTCTDAVQVDAGGSARHDAVVTGNSIPVTYTVGGTNINGCNTAINVSGASTSNTTFSVTNNPTVNAGVGTAINIASNGDSNLRGTISGHTNITVPAGLRDGSSSGTNLENNGFGIDMVADATGSIVVNVDGNTVNGMAGGIRGTARNPGVAEMDATVQNNTFNSGGAFALWPVLIATGNADGQPNRVCVNFNNNQTSTTAAFTEHYWLEQWTSNAFQLQGLAPASGATEAQVEAFVSSRDIGGATVEAFGGTTINYTAATCATP